MTEPTWATHDGPPPDDVLFGDDGLRVTLSTGPPDERTAGQRMRDRQAARIARGYHPLGEPLRLHLYAPRVLEDDKGGKQDYRCGSCVFRVIVGGHARGFPKCHWGYREIPIPEDQRTRFGPKVRIITPRDTRGEATDVRAWWPACVDWQPRADGD